MKFAAFDGQRIEAAPGLSGLCPLCGAIVIAKCGALRVWHWAHKGRLHCDPWYEREGPWHIAWKALFPIEWQEIAGQAANGEKHIADVRTPQGRVIEFQHSHIAMEERLAREAFYGQMIWVVDGLARKRDHKTFFKTLFPHRRDQPIFGGYEIECALLRDWGGCSVDVFFDFGEREEDGRHYGGPILWHLHPNLGRRVALTPILRTAFVTTLHNGVDFQRVSIQHRPAPQPPIPLPGFTRYMRRLARSHRRF